MIFSIIKSALAFVLAIGILSTVHEFGHYCVARFFRIKVLKFSIGFGPSIISWYDKDGVEFSLGCLPLGGYVKLLDASVENIPETDKYMQFETKPLWARTMVVLAGPVANFVLAVLFYWVIFIAGYVSIIPVVGMPPQESMADIAGIKEKQVIMAINDSNVKTWEDINLAIMKQLGTNEPIDIQMQDFDTGVQSTHKINLDAELFQNSDIDVLGNIGLRRFDPLPPLILRVAPGYPAEQSGLLPGDLILSIDKQNISTRATLIYHLSGKANKEIMIDVKRGDLVLSLPITPQLKLEDGGHEVGFIGIEFEPQPWPKEFQRPIENSLVSGFSLACSKTYEYILITYKFIYKMITGKMSLSHLSGPVTIANYAGQTFQYGWQPFFSFLALISISLGAINLLPIPLLDGGYLLYFFAEFILGRPVSEKVERLGYSIGIFFVSAMMLLAISNDISRFL